MACLPQLFLLRSGKPSLLGRLCANESSPAALVRFTCFQSCSFLSAHSFPSRLFLACSFYYTTVSRAFFFRRVSVFFFSPVAVMRFFSSSFIYPRMYPYVRWAWNAGLSHLERSYILPGCLFCAPLFGGVFVFRSDCVSVTGNICSPHLPMPPRRPAESSVREAPSGKA